MPNPSTIAEQDQHEADHRRAKIMLVGLIAAGLAAFLLGFAAVAVLFIL